MIKLIFGCSGSGKTAYVTNKIKESVAEGKRTYLLVPEQQVFTAEAMLADLPPKSALCFEVISFSRLCDIVFDKYGGKNYTSVSSGIRNLIMWSTIKELDGSLSEYGNMPSDAKFASMMLSTYDELKANLITPERLDKIIESGEHEELAGKLSDISLVVSCFTHNLQKALGEGAVLSENKLERLRECLRRNIFFEDANVFIDSFTDFTKIQHDIILEIMKQAKNLHITVYSKARGYHAPHMESVSETVKRLTADCRESSQPFDDFPISGNTRTHSLQLKLLEANLWNFTASRENIKHVPEEQSHDIEMVSCANEYEETECAALKILSAHKNGTKYSEMAVILRNPEERSGIIDAVFSKYNIPYFLSEKTGLSNTPSARFILSSLRCISRGYRQEDVLTLLKTGLCGIDSLDADLFEEYCHTWNIQGKTFTEEAWSMNPGGYKTRLDERSGSVLASANKVRRLLISPLEELKIKLRAASGNTTEMCRCVYEYLCERKLSEGLSRLAEVELSMGNVKDAGEILRTYDYIVSTLSSICTVLPDSRLTIDELYTAIEIMLSNTDIASVPSIGEYVTIGSAATLRVENIKLAIVSELCEGVFPALPKETSLISESDKEKIESPEVTFKTRKSRLMSDELFYVYRAFSKPYEKLIVTTYSSCISGSARTPSTPWRRLKSLFDLQVEEFDMKAVKALSNEMRAERSKAELAEHVSEMFGEGVAMTEHVPPEVVRTAFGDSLFLSKSKIQSFIKCPMSFWSSSILDLRSSGVAELGAVESGLLVHFVLENLLKEAHIDGSLPRKTDGELLALTNKWVESYVDFMRCPRTPAIMFAFSKLRNMAYLMVKNVFDEFSTSKFKIHSFEQKISLTRGLAPWTIPLDSVDGKPSIYLGGDVDRIDTYTSNGKTYIRVIDYKTGPVSYSEEDVMSGKDVQLPAYLFTVASDKNKKAFTDGEIAFGASIYLSACESKGDISIQRSGIILNDDEFISAANTENNLSFVSTALANEAGEGELYDAEQMLDLKLRLEQTIQNIGCQIFSGVINRTPSAQSCKYCPIKATCPVACKSKY